MNARVEWLRAYRGYRMLERLGLLSMKKGGDYVDTPPLHAAVRRLLDVSPFATKAYCAAHAQRGDGSRLVGGCDKNAALVRMLFGPKGSLP